MTVGLQNIKISINCVSTDGSENSSKMSVISEQAKLQNNGVFVDENI